MRAFFFYVSVKCVESLSGEPHFCKKCLIPAMERAYKTTFPIRILYQSSHFSQPDKRGAEDSGLRSGNLFPGMGTIRANSAEIPLFQTIRQRIFSEKIDAWTEQEKPEELLSFLGGIGESQRREKERKGSPDTRHS